jgi:hypothetical protein
MANLGRTDSSSPGRIGALGNWLLLLAGVGAMICCGDLNQERPDARPPAQVGQDDYGGPVWSIAYSPDNTCLAATAHTRDVWLRDLATGQSFRIQEGSSGTARSLAFSQDGRVLAVAGGGPEVRLWDERWPLGRATLPASANPIRCGALYSMAARSLRVSTSIRDRAVFPWTQGCGRRPMCAPKCRAPWSTVIRKISGQTTG